MRHRRITIWALYVLVIAICSSIVLISIPHGKLITGGDASIPELAPDVAFHNVTSTWNSAAGMGRDFSLSRNTLFPLILFDMAMARIGLSPTFINHFWLIFIFALQGALTLRLFLELFPSARFLPALAFVSIASVLNPYMLIAMHTLYPTTALGIAIFPGVLAAMLRFSRTTDVRNLAEFFLWAAASAVAVNPAIVMVDVGVLSIAAFAFAIEKWRRRELNLWPFGQVLLVYGSVFSVWYVPTYHFLTSNSAAIVSETARYSADTVRVTSSFSPLTNVARLVGGYLYFNELAGHHPFFPEGTQYVSNGWLVAATTALPLLAACSVFALRLYGWRVAVIIGVAALALFFAKGTSWPLGSVFTWASSHIALFSGFRNSYEKCEWVVVYAYALLAGVTLVWLSTRLPSAAVNSLTALAFFALCAASYPMLEGHLFWATSSVKIPERYFSLGHWLNAHPERTLQLPVAPVLFDAYDWGYVGAGINYNLTRAPIVARVWDFEEPGNADLDDLFQNFSGALNSSEIGPLLGLVGIVHVVTDPSADVRYYGGTYAEGMPAPPSGLTESARFGNIISYDVSRQLRNTDLYIARQAFITDDTLADIARVCGIAGSCRSSVFLSRDVASGLPIAATDTFDRVGASAGGSTQWWYEAAGVSMPTRAGAGANVRGGRVSGMTLLDFANGTTPDAPSVPDRYRVLTGTKPVAISISSREVQGGFLRLAGKDVNLCADPESANSYDWKVPMRSLRDGVALFATTYHAPQGGAAVAFLDPTIKDNVFYAPLRRARSAGSFARLFRLDKADTQLVIRFLVTGSNARRCAAFHQATVAISNQGRKWTLLGSRYDYHATPPYFAAQSRAWPLENKAFRPAAKTQVLRAWDAAKPYAPSDLAEEWSLPETIDSAPNASAFGIATTLRSRPALRLRTSDCEADVRAYFDHLIPGAEYVAILHDRKLFGSPPDTLLLSEGAPLPVRTSVAKTGTYDIAETLTFDLPPDRTSVTFYEYAGSVGEYSSNVLEFPELRLTRARPRVVGMAQAHPLPLPRLLAYETDGQNDLKITVRGAPSRYMLVATRSYSPDWKLDAPIGTSVQHLRANVFQNAWIVEGPSEQILRLHYANDDIARRAVKTAAGILAVAFIPWGALIGQLLPHRARRRRRADEGANDSASLS